MCNYFCFVTNTLVKQLMVKILLKCQTCKHVRKDMVINRPRFGLFKLKSSLRNVYGRHQEFVYSKMAHENIYKLRETRRGNKERPIRDTGNIEHKKQKVDKQKQR